MKMVLKNFNGRFINSACITDHESPKAFKLNNVSDGLPLYFNVIKSYLYQSED